ncbi:MarR family transcriptional regulator [Microbacterium sp. NPDC089189]|uniref:MarR family winged helix-turn-helix transcriptional regulator n=1 Tax=Microbacterium sp. NPDC089189 TaxID=3154972 RepID=UPI0034473C03
MEFPVPRMDERESRAWRGLVGVLQLLPAALDTELQRDAGITHFEFSVLTALRFSPDATLPMTELATTTVATLPRLSHVCARLEKRGLIARVRSDVDRRVTLVRLTGEGRRTLIHAIPEHIATVRALVVDALSPAQLDALAEISATITARIRPAADPA